MGTRVSLSLPSSTGALVTVPLPSARVTVVDFWAPSCAPCRKKLPALVAREAALNAAGARLVLVAVLSDGESTADAESTLGSWGVQRPFLIDRGDASRSQAGVDHLPSTLVLEQTGDVRWVAPVEANADDVLAAVR